MQVARALAAAEACGVVHRDLKPSNLMLTARQGETGEGDGLVVKVIDWGLAKAVSAELVLGADHTHGAFVGTPAFASPEQFAVVGDGRIDTRSDIYSLGVTLWYLLCGRSPFVGTAAQVIQARQSGRALPMGHLTAAGVPAPVVALLKSLLRAEPAARPQSARELLDALRHCQEGFAAATPGGARRGRLRRWTVALSTLAAVGITALGAWWVHARAPLHQVDRSVAVLPFENLSPDPADAFFTVGVQDEITADLARIGTLKVVGPDSPRAYPPKGRDHARIGRELGVGHLLEGSVQREGERVQITVRLVAPGDFAHSWSEQYDRRLADVFAVQGEITRAVAEQLRAPLSSEEKTAINRPPTSDLAAYDLYLRAREGPNIYKDSAELRRRYESQIPLLEAAVARDPGFVFAYCGLAKAHDKLSSRRFADTAEARAIDHRAAAEAALATARRLRPDAGEVRLAYAQHYFAATRDSVQARIEVDLARRALPNSAEVEELAGQIARGQDRWEDAIRHLERAVTLEPRENVNRFTLANTYRLLRRYGKFDRLMDQVIATMTTHDSAAYRLFRAMGSLEAQADLAPLRAAIHDVSTADDPSGELRDEYGLILALNAHDADAVSRLLAATSQTRFFINGVTYPKAWFAALAARMRGDRSGAQTAFTAARVLMEKAVLSDALDGRSLSVLAIIDAGLENREDAVREALRACELFPSGKSSINAAIVASNLAVVYAWTERPDLAFAVLEEWVNRPAGLNLPAQPTYGDLWLNPL